MLYKRKAVWLYCHNIGFAILHSSAKMANQIELITGGYLRVLKVGLYMKKNA
jgi:hypothetical protein